jgi:hypothetical protein
MESGDCWFGRSGSGTWQASTSKVVAPPVSVKDRWFGPHEQVLNIPITCRWYGPGKPSTWLPTWAWLKPSASLVGLGEKLGTDSWIGQPACCGLCREPFFSGAVGSIQIYWHLTKGCYTRTTWDTYGLGLYTDRAWKACGMLVGFSPVGCTSIRIAVTLRYE